MSSDNYLWSGPVAGSWDVAGNWYDSTTAVAATAAPGADNAVTIATAAAGAVQTITGAGASASLIVQGATDLSGQFTTGALNVQVSDSTGQPLVLGSGDSLAVSGAVTSDGTIQVNGGSFSAAGPVSTFNLQASSGGVVQVGGAFTGQLQIDSSSTAEIGSSNSATAGQIVIDAGATTTLSGLSATDIINNGTAEAFFSATNTLVNNGVLTGGGTAASITNTGTLSGESIGSDASGGALTNSGTISGFTDLNFSTIVNSGTIAVTNADPMDLVGSVTGTGQITIGDGLMLQISGQVASSNTITFLGSGDSLLVSASLDAPIAGFGPTDVIDFSGSGYVTSASAVNGTLTLYQGATSVATLQLAGDYTGRQFVANPAASEGGFSAGSDVTQIDLVTGGDTSTPPAGTSTSDTYLWSGPVAGSWDAAANWSDTTTGGTPAALAPGVNDAVTVDAAAGAMVQVITGLGASASLTLEGATDLAGQFTTGALSFQVPTQTLLLGTGDTLAVSGDVASDGTIAVNGGAFTVTGAASVGNLEVADSGSVQLGGGFTGQLQVDSSSAAEIGSLQTATAGEMVIDAGAAATLTGSSATDIINNGAVVGDLSASNSIVNNGTMSGDLAGSLAGSGALTNTGTISGFANLDFATIANSGTIAATDTDLANLIGSVTGSGQITLAAGATLQVSGPIASGQTITFEGADASLLVSGSLESPIAGFAASDVIEFSGDSTVTSATYANGTLTLDAGATAVASLQLVGDYTGMQFVAAPAISPNGDIAATQISLSDAGDAPLPVLTLPALISTVASASTAVAVTIADAAVVNETLTIALTDQAGLLSANSGVSGGGGAIAGSGTTNLYISGTLAELNADLSTLTIASSSAGSDAIAVAVDDGQGGLASGQIAVSVVPAYAQTPPADFNGAGLSDIVWRNTNGDAGVWLTTSGDGGFTPVDFGVVDNSWQIQAVGDFNGDGAADLLWRNSATGQVGEWLSNSGSSYAGFTTPILATVDPSWQIDGVGAFNGAGLSDILWRNTNGDTGVWITTVGGGFTPVDFGVVDNSWQIQGVGDFNGDGKADILWRNNITGQVGEWLSNAGSSYAGFTTPILAAVDPSWTIQGVGDFDGDGLSDILWRNTNGDTGVWLTTAGGGFTVVDFGVVDQNWQIQGVGDFNGDGKADILWRNTSTGAVGEWLSTVGSGFTGFTTPTLATVDPSWAIQGQAPASQTMTGSSAAAFAHVMAAMGAKDAAAATAVAAAPAAHPPVIAVAGHGAGGVTGSA